MENESVGPFENYDTLIANLKSYKSSCQHLRSYELAELWDTEELSFIRDMFDNGDAYALV